MEVEIGASNTVDAVLLAGVTFEEIVVTGQGVGKPKEIKLPFSIKANV